MFGIFKRHAVETRSAEVDLGSLYAAIFGLSGGGYSWAQSPAILVASLAVQNNAGALLTESRRLGRTSPLLLAYRRVIEAGILTGEAEPPTFDDSVPEAVVDGRRRRCGTAAHDLRPPSAPCSTAWWSMAKCCSWTTVRLSRRTGSTPVEAGPEWMREVVGYKIGTASTARMAGTRYIGDRPMGATRALAVDRPGAPGGGWPVECADRRRARARGHGADRRGGQQHQSGQNHGERGRPFWARRSAGCGGDPRATQQRPGGIRPFPETWRGPESDRGWPRRNRPQVRGAARARRCRRREPAFERAVERLQHREFQQSADGLGQDAEREITLRRRWWHRHYRLPVYLDVLADAFAAGRLPRMSMATMAALKRPAWRGPKRQPPQPEKEAQSLALLAREGIISADDARDQLET